MSNFWDDIFDDRGMFKAPGDYDPMRCRAHQEEFHNKIFDEDGDVHFEIPDSLVDYITEKGFGWSSDAVELLYAEKFSGNTKGNYSTIYMWR